MVTLHHLLTSIETRPAARAFHLSFRSESFLVEGVTLEQDLVPIITAEQPSGGGEYHGNGLGIPLSLSHGNKIYSWTLSIGLEY